MGASFRSGIDIIVVNYKSPIDLTHFFKSLLAYPPDVPWSLHVVNVDPEEEDERIVQLFSKEPSFRGRLDYMKFEENIGYARAVNWAARRCVRETIGIFNADTRFRENVANECHYALHSNPQWGVLGPRQVDDEGRITAAGIFGTADRPRDRAFHLRNSEQYADIRDDAVTVSGSAYFIKGHVWNELTACPIYRKSNPISTGAFLPTPLYYEETFCSYHARAHDYKVVYYGPVTMVHRWHKAPRTKGSDGMRVMIARQMFRRACDEHDIEHE